MVGVTKFENIAAKELERYAGEKKTFKEVTQKKFDEENGLSRVPIVQDRDLQSCVLESAQSLYVLRVTYT